MAKAIICCGNKTDSILEKLEYNVGGIDLIGCPFVSDLEKTINASGKVSKILIFESSINGDVPEIIKSSMFNTIFILNKPELMEQFDIAYYGIKNIQIINNGGKTVSFVFMKELISASTIEDYLLYKSGNLQAEPTQEPASLAEETPSVVESPSPRVVTEEEAPNLMEGPSLVNPAPSPDLFEEPIPQRQVSLEKEERVGNLVVNSDMNIPIEKRIKNQLGYYSTGCILTFVGTPKAYTTTTAFNIAKAIAKLDCTVALVDLDTQSYSLSSINRDVFNQFNRDPINNLEKALRETNMIKNSILIESNLQLLTSALNQDSIDLKNQSQLDLLYKLIDKYRTAYKVIIFDVQLKDINTLKFLMNTSSKIVFNIPATNKDYLHFMRNIETADDEIREALFNRSCYISVNDKKQPLLNTKQTDLSAIDTFLHDNYEIINEYKYENIPKIGTIEEDKSMDYLNTMKPTNDKEIHKFILKILGGQLE